MAGESIAVGLVVSDADQALAFYRDTLGLAYEGETPLFDGAVVHQVTAGESTIKLFVPATSPEEHASPEKGETDLNPMSALNAIMSARGLRYITLVVPDIEAVVAKCQAAGYRVPMPVQSFGPEASIAVIVDPEGNWIELGQHG
jgi:catechol 2,3-dioxygenase-like lactoylglutathione lyase family enzyme